MDSYIDISISFTPLIYTDDCLYTYPISVFLIDSADSRSKPKLVDLPILPIRQNKHAILPIVLSCVWRRNNTRLYNIYSGEDGCKVN